MLSFFLSLKVYEIDTGPVVIKEVFLRGSYMKHSVAEESAVQHIKKFTSGLLYEVG